jgi:hypothetical protein
MKHGLAVFAFALAVLGLAGCQSPVNNPQSVTSSNSTLPLGKGSGVTVYAATADGNGVLMFSSTATNWVTLDWSGIYPANGSYYQTYGIQYPPVNDITVSSGVVYAATSDGLIVGSGSSWHRYLQGKDLSGVSVSENNVFLSGPVQAGFCGLVTVTTASPGGTQTPLITLTNGGVTQWTAWGGGGAAATSQGVYYSGTTTGAYTVPTVTGTALNAGTVNSVYSSGSTLYAGTALGYSTTSPAGTFSWTNTTGLGNVNGILPDGSGGLYLATATGLVYYVSPSSSSNWQLSGVAVNNIVADPGTTNYFFSNGSAGLGILQFDSSGDAYVNSVLTWTNVSKVFVTTP